MHTNPKWNLLFIKDDNSLFNLETNIFSTLFDKVDKVTNEESLTIYNNNKYDIVVGDLSVRLGGITLLKQIKNQDSKQTIFALVSEKDTDKLYGIAELGIHSFELDATQFDQALETIAGFNPYE